MFGSSIEVVLFVTAMISQKAGTEQSKKLTANKIKNKIYYIKKKFI